MNDPNVQPDPAKEKAAASDRERSWQQQLNEDRNRSRMAMSQSGASSGSQGSQGGSIGGKMLKTGAMLGGLATGGAPLAGQMMKGNPVMGKITQKAAAVGKNAIGQSGGGQDTSDEGIFGNLTSLSRWLMWILVLAISVIADGFTLMPGAGSVSAVVFFAIINLIYSFFGYYKSRFAIKFAINFIAFILEVVASPFPWFLTAFVFNFLWSTLGETIAGFFFEG